MRAVFSLALATALAVPTAAAAQPAAPTATAQPPPAATAAPPVAAPPPAAPPAAAPAPTAAPQQPAPQQPQVVYQPAPTAPPPPPPPPPDDEWWKTTRPRERHGAKIPLAITGSVLSGLGVMTLFAAGITWLTAYGHSRELDDKCYTGTFQIAGSQVSIHQSKGYCVKGTPGGDAYERARDAAIASRVLVGVAVPLMATGLSLSILSIGLRGETDKPRYATQLKATGQGLVLEGSF